MAQHQGRKRKGDSAHDQPARDDVPTLSIKLPKKSDLPNTSKPWSDVQLPVDILLMTVEDCEFLACYAFLRNPFRSYQQNLGFVYFGTIGESGYVPLNVAMTRCFEGSSDPCGSLVTVKNAVVELRPKAVFSVGCCVGLNPAVTKLQLGDVVVSSKLTTGAFKTPVGRGIMQLVKHADDGWIPPLTSPEDHKVQVCCDGEIISGTDSTSAKRQCMSDSTKAVAFVKGGGGLFAAAHDVNLEWLIVKGISHFSDDSNTPDESWKSFASIMAASLVSNMLNDPVVFKEWPHYEDVSANKASSTLPDSVCLKECQKKLRALYETKNRVKIVPWEQTSAVDINKIYTDLSWVMDHRTPRGVTKEALNHYTEIFVRREPHPAPKRILVYGQPGIGKTVFTQKVTFDWCQQKFPQTLGAFDLVLLVRLRDVCDLRDVPSILAASRALASDGTVSVDNLYNYVRRHQEKVLLILDGYDEYVYTAGNQSPVLEIWNENQLSNCCVVITSREMKAETLRSSGDAVFKIDGFNDRRQEEYAGRFLKDGEDVKNFFNYLEQQDLRKLAQIPLLLLIMCLLWKGKDRNALPKKRADIFTQFVKTLFHHMREKQSVESVFNIEDYSDELYALGRTAFEALINDCLYIPRSELPNYDLIERLIEVGLFQVLNISSLNPEKGVYFIHKSVQEYFAGCFLKEELILSKKNEITNSLSKLDSVEKILKMNEVIKFAGELSEEAAREIVIHLMKMAANEEELTKYTFDSEAPSEQDFSKDQRNFLTLCTELFFYCSAETKRNLFPTFLSSFRGVLLIEADQLNDLVKVKLVKTTVNVNYVFFTNDKEYTERDYKNLTILSEQLNAVIVSCSGEKKASEFLSNLTWCPVGEFFLKKEENNTHLYFTYISTDRSGFRAHDIIKALISKQETTTKKTNMNGDESSEESSSSCCLKRHGLSRVRRIEAWDVNRSDVEQLIKIMPFITAPHVIQVWGEPGEVLDAELNESLLRSIPITLKLEDLSLSLMNVTSSPAVEFIDSLFEKAPNLKSLYMSFNPLLGAGVDSLINHLSCAPHLETLYLPDVKMTPQQVMNLTSAVQQHGNITELWSFYHKLNGDPQPKYKWPSEDDWKRRYPRLFPDSSSGLGDDQEQDDSSAESDDDDEENEEGIIESEDERSSSEPEDNQEQQDDSSADHDDEEASERDEEGMIESEDERSSSEPEDNQEQILAETHPSVHGSPFLAHDPDTVGTFSVPPDPAAGLLLAAALSPAVHGSSHGLASFSGYLPSHVDPQHHSSPDIETHHDNTPSTIFTPAGSWGSDPYLPSGSGLSAVSQDKTELEFLSVDEVMKILADLPLDAHPSTQDVLLHDPAAVRPVPVPLDPAADPVLTGASITTAHGSFHGLALVEPFSDNPVHIHYPQHYSSPVIQSHHHSTLSSTFTPGRSLGSDSYLVGDLGLSTFTQSEPNLGSLSVDEILAELQWNTRPSTQDVLLQDPGAVGSVPVPLDPAVSAPVSTAHDFNHGLAPSSEDPPLQGMPEPSLYGLQTQSTIAGDPHCFSGSSSSTVPPLLGTSGYLSSHGMMGQSMHGLQTLSTIPGVTQSSGSGTTTVTHPPGIPGYVSPHGMQSSSLPSMQSRSPVISEHTQNTDTLCNESGTSS